ncbi:hypothetical protein RCL1_004050 [Eukaryota sp. TZLM3-RCL]
MFGERVILQRRQQEQVRCSYLDYANTSQKLSSYATFDERSVKDLERRRVMDQFHKLSAEKTARLDDRRRKIAARYALDFESWMNGLKSLEESPTERRERVLKTASALKAERLAHAQQYAKKMEQLKWEQNCDPLRTAKSKLLAEETSRLWALQINEKEARRLAMAEINHSFNLMEREQMEKKRLEEEKRDEVKRQRDLKSKLELEGQLADRQAERDRLLQERQDELFKIRQEFLQQELEAQKLEESRHLQAKSLREELNRINSILQAEKRAIQQQEALRDKQIIEEQLKLAEIERLRDVYRAQLKRQQTIDSYNSNLQTRAKKQEDDALIEKLCQEAADREWARKEERWRKEHEARRQLLKECDEYRRREIQNRINNYENERESERQAAVELQQKLRMEELRDLEAEVVRKSEAKILADYQLQQAALVKQRQEEEKLSKLMEDHKIVAAVTEEEEKIKRYLSAIYTGTR